MPTSREHYQKLIKTLRDRLEVLELQRAKYGIDVPPHIETQIEDIGLEIRAIDASVTALDTVADLASSSGDRIIDRRDQANYEQRQHIMIATVQATIAELSGVRVFVRDEIKKASERMDTFARRMDKFAIYGVITLAGNFLALAFIIGLVVYFLAGGR